jgi:tRNA nucleotidyltransferase/poly(A) polymerase
MATKKIIQKLLREAIESDGRKLPIRMRFDMSIPKDVIDLADIFKKSRHVLYIVGGAVRDALIGKSIKDYDLATDATPDKVLSIIANAGRGYRTLATGKSFGVINVITDTDEYEIATFRSDEFDENGPSGGHKPKGVKFTNIETDVNRRDLTINALFYDIEKKEIVDYVGGIEDIKNRVVKTVGNPKDRFLEDRLRILRAVRFAARYGSELDSAVDSALKKDSSLEGISGERIRDEFLKGLSSAKSVSNFLEMLEKYNLFDWIFKGLSVDKDFVDSKDYITVIANLLKRNDAKVIAKKLNAIKYTLEEVRAIVFLVNLLSISEDNAVALKRAQKNSGVSNEQIKQFAKMNGLNTRLIDAFLKFELSVSGDEIMKKYNLKQSKELGDRINQAETENFLKLLK